MKPIAALLLLLTATAAHADPFAQGNAQAGKNLFDQYHCNRCHMAIEGGDGSRIFTRINHKVTNPRQLVAQLHICGGNVGLDVTPQQEQDLGAYLNQNYYHFK
ncbi:MAG: cytochrome c [Sideroxydans sp.]|nr:cytochrome c [Sideroxydans sp.]